MCSFKINKNSKVLWPTKQKVKKIEKKTLENNRFVKNWRIYERTNSIDKKRERKRKITS